MGLTLPETLMALATCRARIDAVLRHTPGTAARAARLTTLLRELWPASTLYGCLLHGEGPAQTHVRDEEGQARPQWADLLSKKLAGSSRGRKKPVRTVKMPRGLKLSDQFLAVEEITFEDRRWGALALALPAEVSLETTAAARVLLAATADQLAVRLHGEAQSSVLNRLRAELADHTWLSNIGELAGPVVHAINNFLNVVSLHVTVLEEEVSQEQAAELVEIRRQGSTLAALVRHFQQYRQPPQAQPESLDLNQLVQEILAEANGSPLEPLNGHPVRLILASDLPLIQGSVADLKRLVRFLVRSATAAVQLTDGLVTVRTEQAANCVRLRIEDSGPPLQPELLRQLFEPEIPGRGTASNLELAACRSLVRRLHGKITAENPPAGGVTVTVELPLAEQALPVLV